MSMITTTLRAAWLHAWNRPKEAPVRFWKAFKTVFISIKKHEESSRELASIRMNACCQCPLFDFNWNACGNGAIKTLDGEFVGCLCYMPFKVTIPTATCWLHDQGVTDQGWPKEL